jgi:maltose O-acetyltransferase
MIRRLMLLMAVKLSHSFPPTRAFALKRFLYNCSGCRLGKGVSMVGRSRISFSNVKIGSDTWVGDEVIFYSSVTGSITIGNRCDIAPRVTFNTGTHIIGSKHRRAGSNIAHDISIGNGCWVGMGAIILSGSKVGDGCIIAAGAVVKGEFPENVLIAGVPAVIKRKL